ncbi:hypothetical protein ABIE59_003697 [Marinobacter sp. MBR-99]|jgi:hypothetical protein|uniref:choice-of-anchor Q domain-containing protein n=1 Tax=Marinobacter sp. MBR-99 TaxID=3156461 RepID=UPI00339A591D
MKKSAPWWIAAGSVLFLPSAIAAELTVSNSSQLQEALSQAAASYEDDTIILQPGVYATNAQPFSYFSDNGGSLTIKSADSDNRAILDGQGLSAVLRLEHTNSGLLFGETDDTEISLEHLVVRNGIGDGNARDGAGLWVKGAHLKLEQSSLENHVGAGSDTGAALYFYGNRDKNIILSGTAIENNTASTSSRAAVVFIDRANQFTLTDGSSVSGNTGNAGVVKLDNSPAIIEKNSQFIDNITRAYGVIYPDPSNYVQIRSSQFIGNETTTNTGSGVLYYGAYQIDDALFENNKAVGYAVGTLNRVKDQYIRNSRFISNESTGGGIVRLGDITGNQYALNNSLFAGNVASGTDNGIVTCNAICEIANNIFDRNTGSASVHSRRSIAQDSTIANSVFLGTNDVLSFKDSNSRATLINNFLDPQRPQLIHTQTIQRNNIQNLSDSGLDTSNDYQILDNSPLIDAGTTDASEVSLTATDIRGNARVFGDSVDIGWEEYGSSMTVPVITQFELVTTGASNLDLLQFRLEYDVAEGTDFEYLSVEVKTDETEIFETVSLQDNLFDLVMMEGGPHTVTAKVTNTSEGVNEFATQDISFRLKTLSAEEVFERAELHAKELCADKPIDCGIDTDAIQQAGFESGYAEALELCRLNPESEICDIDLQTYIDHGYANGFNNGKATCVQEPESCGINTGGFDGTLIPEMSSAWELFGTGQEITTTDLPTTFADAQIVWAKTDDTWRAWSPNTATRQLLQNNNVPLVESIPANSGFWVKK